jgi:hypothetical protein
MARPPKYATEDDKPVSVTFRIPRDLYDKAQQHAHMRQTTLTELVLDGLRWRLETPTDPRDILATQDSTVMQELRQMIADEVQAALAAQRCQASESTPARQREDNSKTQHYRNATPGQASAPQPGPSLVTEPARPAPGHFKLTARQAAALRAKRARGTPMKVLMEEYSISKATLFRYLKER